MNATERVEIIIGHVADLGQQSASSFQLTALSSAASVSSNLQHAMTTVTITLTPI